MKDFFELIKDQKFEEALSFFNSIAHKDKIDILEIIFQRLKQSEAPKYLAVLQRITKKDKDVHDFCQAWLPPEEDCHPEGEYLNYFSAPTQVMLATNISNPNDIIAVGNMWASREEIFEEIERVSESEQKRHEAIEKIATKNFGQLYKVDYNLHLGTKFK